MGKRALTLVLSYSWVAPCSQHLSRTDRMEAGAETGWPEKSCKKGTETWWEQGLKEPDGRNSKGRESNWFFEKAFRARHTASWGWKHRVKRTPEPITQALCGLCLLASFCWAIVFSEEISHSFSSWTVRHPTVQVVSIQRKRTYTITAGAV